MRSIANALVHPTLARRDGDAGLGAQAIQGDANLARVARRDAVGEDVDFVAGVAQVKRGLGDTDVRLNADKRDLRRHGQGGSNRRDVHGEARLVMRR